MLHELEINPEQVAVSLLEGKNCPDAIWFKATDSFWQQPFEHAKTGSLRLALQKLHAYLRERHRFQEVKEHMILEGIDAEWRVRLLLASGLQENWIIAQFNDTRRRPF